MRFNFCQRELVTSTYYSIYIQHALEVRVWFTIRDYHSNIIIIFHIHIIAFLSNYNYNNNKL